MFALKVNYFDHNECIEHAFIFYTHILLSGSVDKDLHVFARFVAVAAPRFPSR